ncbi:MAG: hypothetical protein VX970_02785 [Planctomycetota bacterium]|nr:hypothetical protein [Planctomycetota bacterium]
MVENAPENLPAINLSGNCSQATTGADHTQHHQDKHQFRYIPSILKGIVSVIIVALFVVLGKNISKLYQTASFKPDAISLVPGAEIGGPITVRFGDAPFTIFRQEIDGDLTTASTYLKKVCFSITENSGYPRDMASSAEQTLLQNLLNKKNQHAVDSVRVCALSPGNPTYVGIKSKPVDHSKIDLIQESRIVAWGFATQVANHRWKLQVVSYESPENITGLGSSMNVSLPPGSQRLLHMDSPTGESVMAFTSRSNMEAQIEFFNEFFEANEWKQKNQWSISQNNGYGTYIRLRDNGTQRITIHLQRNQMNPKGNPQNGDQANWQGIISLVRHSLRP